MRLIKNEKLFLGLYIVTAVILAIFFAKKGMESLILGVYIGIVLILILLKNPKSLIYAQIIYNLIIKYAINGLGIPSFANYFTDVLTILILFCAIKKYLKNKENLNIKNWMIVVGLLLLESIIGLIINEQRIMLYVWGIRNTYRFFAFLFGCIVLLNKKDVEKIFYIMYIFLFVNVLLCSYQFFVLRLGQDRVGGTFGVLEGANGYMNMFMVILSTYAMVNFQNKKWKLIQFLLVILSCMYIAAISELKMFYVEVVIIVLIGILLSKPNFRTIMIILGSAITLYIAIQVLYNIYPGFKNFFNLEKMISYASKTGYAREDQLNRLTAIDTLDKSFLKKQNRRLIGIGTGNAEVSRFKVFNSEFAKNYSKKLAYNWFLHSFIFLENGYIGLIIYIVFFIIVFCDNIKFKKKDNAEVYLVAQIISLISILLMCYDLSLRTEAAYMWFFTLSIGYIYNKLKNNNIEMKKIDDKD